MGKYIKKFDTHSDYEDFIETEDFIRPNVSYCVDNKDVHYNSIQTLFALEIESGRFISFYFQSGMLYGNTDDGSSALWVCDGNGVVVDNISIYGAERAPILEQINEHYGTSFTGWSDNEMGLRFGDTVPNWNAYEKIEMPAPNNLFKLKHANGQYFFMQLDDGILTVSGEGLRTYVYNDTTGYQSGQTVPKGTFQQELGDKLVYSSIVTKNLEENYQIPDFDKYIEIQNVIHI